MDGRVGYGCIPRRAARRDHRLPRQEGHALPPVTFAHGALATLGDGLPSLLCSYHPSLQNTNTGRLTPAMMDGVLAQAAAFLR